MSHCASAQRGKSLGLPDYPGCILFLIEFGYRFLFGICMDDREYGFRRKARGRKNGMNEHVWIIFFVCCVILCFCA